MKSGGNRRVLIWRARVGRVLIGHALVGLALVGCHTKTKQLPPPVYKTPPLPAWEAPPPEEDPVDALDLEGEWVEGPPPGVDMSTPDLENDEGEEAPNGEDGPVQAESDEVAPDERP